MYHPTARVLAVLELLQAHPGLNSTEIAARLEVDRRTVRRYITMLGDMGIPVQAERGPHGGYRLQPGFKLPPLMLSGEEALAVTLSLVAAREGIPADPHSIAGALAKLERVLPHALRERLAAVQSVVAFGPSTATPQPSGELVLAMSEAAEHQHRVRIGYLSQSGETVRDIDPYGVVRYRNRWYAIGWCHLRRAMRVFRLDQIVAFEQRPEAFTRPAGFDAPAELLAALASVPGGWPAEILLETTLEDAERQLSDGNATLELVDGGVVLRICADRLPWLARLLMTLECPFVVRRPPELRAALRELAEEATVNAAREA